MQLEDFLPMVLPYATGCAEIQAEHAVRQAATEFFDRTDAWTQDLDEVLTVAGETDYEFEIDAQSTITRLLRVRIGGQDVPLVRRGSSAGIDYSPARVAMAVDRATLRILGAPAVDDVPILVSVALAPSPRAVSITDSVARPHANAITYGALSRLLMMPGKPFTDMRAAQVFEAKFIEAINTAKARAFYQNAHAPARVTPSYF
jgi:hypothetical protein